MNIHLKMADPAAAQITNDPNHNHKKRQSNLCYDKIQVLPRDPQKLIPRSQIHVPVWKWLNFLHVYWSAFLIELWTSRHWFR